ncbi:DUF3040 domain-containing protein [Corynebacterium sp. sy017]|uniref:DUF3040 domain-containing protein n=1 Tax=unclassified Corynebacterium TaxID=2624378 RepID=UPI0011863775|nr:MULTISPECIES: DUF3040 domain-containing protein [unclassified Corynebacterium]MBP3087968.1 DUF3040 domain-containing protein [Corynebacterium sp. sy017]QDZ42925.1 DUF3040 domain-containing protein [Corynebacterium sp. sy039]TSD92499.1 DUF3040 domain-containing protein [Corynebacterium sp. SY003]
MSLSEQEQQALREIERSLMAEDPKFSASVMSDNESHGSGMQLSLRGIAIVVVGLLMLVGGVALSPSSTWFVVLSIIGFLVMLAGGIWMLHGGGSAAISRGSMASKTAKPRSSSGLGQRMENNFHRRFEA